MKHTVVIPAYLTLLILLSWSPAARAQQSEGGVPYCIARALPSDTSRPVLFVAPPQEQLDAEDRLMPVPYRFAVNLPAGLDIRQTGRWTTLRDGGRVWRASVTSPGAKSLILYFDRYRLPEGGRLFVYNPGRTQILGAYTSANHNDRNTFATGLLAGDQAVIEYDAPEGTPLPEIRISEVGHAYRGVSRPEGTRNGFKGSGDCQVNINCPEGDAWTKQKRSITRIAVKRGGGSIWCTGSLVDNVRHDGKPYILTADHCGALSSADDISQWIFYFNYESAGCPVPDQEPAAVSMTGATLVAHGGNMGYSGSDFFLVLLNENVPSSYHVYYNGWSRETEPVSPSGVSLHHPMGDIKKVSTYTTPVVAAHWAGNLALSHWRVNWSGTVSGHGTTEGGSSGSPLYNSEGLLIGTLTGGDSSCDTAKLNLPDYYGMFSYHWDRNGTDSASVLKYWLDPDNTNAMTLPGWASSVPEEGRPAGVSVFPNPAGDYVRLQAQSGETGMLQVFLTDVLGNRILARPWNTGEEREITLGLSGVRPGIYLLSLTGGRHHEIRKIIHR